MSSASFGGGGGGGGISTGGAFPLTNGSRTMDLANATLAYSAATGSMELAGFIATKSITANNLWSYLQAAGTSITAVYMALYSLDASNNGTLVVASANTLTLASNTLARNAAPIAATPIVAGTAYAIGYLPVGSATAPSIVGGPAVWSWANTPTTTPPAFMSAKLGSGSLVTPPASFTVGSLIGITNSFLFEVTT